MTIERDIMIDELTRDESGHQCANCGASEFGRTKTAEPCGELRECSTCMRKVCEDCVICKDCQDALGCGSEDRIQ